MARDLNKVMIIGRLGRTPEMRYTSTGKAVTTFSVASSRSWKTSNGENRSDTEWFNIVAWGGLAEVCNQYLEKGQRVYIEGRLQTRRWDDKEGNQKTTVELVASEMIMLSQRTSKSKEGEDDLPENDMDHTYEDYSEEDEFPF